MLKNNRPVGKPLEEARFNQYERRLESLDKRRRRRKTRRKGKTRGVSNRTAKTLNDDEIEDETEQNVITAATTLPPPSVQVPPPDASGEDITKIPPTPSARVVKLRIRAYPKVQHSKQIHVWKFKSNTKKS